MCISVLIYIFMHINVIIYIQYIVHNILNIDLYSDHCILSATFNVSNDSAFITSPIDGRYIWGRWVLLKFEWLLMVSRIIIEDFEKRSFG